MRKTALDTELDTELDTALEEALAVRPAPPVRLLYTVEEAVELLNMSRATLYRLTEAREIPCTKVRGTGLRFSAKNLRDIVAMSEQPARVSA